MTTIPKRIKQTLYTLLMFLFIASCKDDNEISNLLPEAAFNVSNDDPEIGESITFTDTSTDEDGEIVRWIWNFEDGSTATDQNTQHTFTVAGTYEVSLVVTDDDGGQDSATVSLIVTDPDVENQAPTAAFTLSETLVQKGTEVSFTNSSTDADGAIESYAWQFGDGGTSTQQSPTHYYTATGEFTVTLTVTDNSDVSTSVTKDISVWGDKWSFATSAAIRQSSPAIADDGTIYFGSNDDYVYALNADGTQQWAFQTGGAIDTSPTIGPDGTIYIGSDDDYLYALNTDGSQKWAFDTGGDLVNTSAAIESDGSVIYVGTSNNELYAINTTDGSQKWVYTGADGAILSVALGTNQTLYLSYNGSRYLVSLNTDDGSENWSYYHGMYVGGSMAVDEDNTIYFEGDGDIDAIYAIYSDGTKKWSYTLTGSASRGGVVIGDGVLYAATKESSDHLRALSTTDGSLKWSFSTGDALSATPTLDADGNIYIGSFDDSFYVIDADGNQLYEFATGGNIWSTATIGSDGTVYFGSYDYNLYAMEFFASGPNATATWPTLGKDAKHTNAR